MRLAAKCGIPAAECDILTLNGEPFYTVTRFDRETADGITMRLHQEDFYQLLNVPPKLKYQEDGGPGVEDCMRRMTEIKMPAAGKLGFVRLLIFNFLTGNCDAHAKNYAVLYRNGRASFAPAYDLLSTMVYDSIAKRFAMNIGGETRMGMLTRDHFDANCWMESSVVQVYDPRSCYYDPEDRSVLLFLRVNGPSHYAAVLRGREAPDGSLRLETLRRKDGTPEIFFPFPGGHMKFHIVYDDKERFYWMVASHVEHSTTFPIQEHMERRMLGLYASWNLFDWQLTGIVAAGETRLCSRHYAALTIDGEDILVVSRSGDTDAKNTHDTDMITLHRVRNFRRLAVPPVE